MTKKSIITTARLTFNVLLPFIAAGFGAEAWRVLRSASLATNRWPAFLLAGAVFVPVWFIGSRFVPRLVSYLTTLEHELTHLLVGLLFLKRPLFFRATSSEGGQVVLTGGNLWITLAPYFLLTLTLLLMPLALITSSKHERALLTVLGASVPYHLFSTWSEVGVVQSDFRKAGILQSIWLLPIVNLVFYGSVLAYVAGGYGEFGQFGAVV